jgi:hypothetical protein
MQFLKRWIKKRSGFNPQVVPVTDPDPLDPGLDRMLVWHKYGAAERGLTDQRLAKLGKGQI